MTWFAVGTAVVGMVVQNRSNKKAMKQNQDAENRAMAVNQEAGRSASERLGGIEARTRSGTDYLKSILAQNPNQLTPEQAIAKSDAVRRNKETLSGQGFGARTVVASLDDLGKRYDAGAVASNVARRDAVAQNMDTQNVNATTGRANVEIGQAAQNSGIIQSGGVNAANVQIANAAAQGQTLGAIGSIFADQQAQKQREQRYKQYSEIKV